MTLADSHCHLHMLGSPLPDVLARAREAGVSRFLVPGTTVPDSRDAVRLAQEHEDVLAAVGVHPHEAKDFDAQRDGPGLEELARAPGVAAIGEIGLDFHYDLSPRARQVETLEWMLDLARRLELPVILDRKSTRLNSSHGYISYAVF